MLFNMDFLPTFVRLWPRVLYILSIKTNRPTYQYGAKSNGTSCMEDEGSNVGG